MRRLGLLLGLLVAVGNTACDPDNCADLPPSFHLDIHLENDETRPQLLQVDVEAGADRFRRFFEVGDAFSDAKTSIGVELDPVPAAEIELTVTVIAYSGTSSTTAELDRDSATFDLEPNGCNRYRVELDL